MAATAGCRKQSNRVNGSLPLDYTTAILLCIAAVVINLPLGYLRVGHRKYSWQWFVLIHIAVPLIIILRVVSHQGWRVAPLLIVCSVAGQLLGGVIRNAQHKPQPTEVAPHEITNDQDEY